MLSNNIVNIQKILLLVFPSQKSTRTRNVRDVTLKYSIISTCCHSTKGSGTEKEKIKGGEVHNILVPHRPSICVYTHTDIDIEIYG